MTEPEEKIHVIPLGAHWEVEKESGTPLAHEDDKVAAVALARGLARDEGVKIIIVHEGDGVIQVVETAASDAEEAPRSPGQGTA